MAEIPLKVARPQLSSGSVVNYPSGSPVGPAIEQAGRSVQGIADRWQQQQDQLDAFKLRVGLQEFDQTLAGNFQQTAQNMPADGTGFAKGFVGELNPNNPGEVLKPGAFDQTAATFRDRLPESVRGKFDAMLPTYRQEYANKAATLEVGQRRDWYRNELVKLSTGLENAIAQSDPNDPKRFEAFRKQGEDAINASGLNALEKQELGTKWRESAAQAFFQAKLQNDPVAAKAALGIHDEQTFTNISGGSGGAAGVYQGLQTRGLDAMHAAVIAGNVHQESGGNPNSLNKKEGAHGIIQWRDDRWRALQNFAAANGRSPNDINAQMDFILFEGKGNERAAFDRFLSADTPQEANRALKGYIRYGDNSEGTRLQNAIALASGKGLNQGQGPTLAAAQGGTRTVPGSIGTPDPEFADLSLQDRLRLANEADRAINAQITASEQAQRQAAADAKLQYEGYKDSVNLGIVQGTVRDESEIAGDMNLNDGDKAALIKAFRSEQGKNVQIRQDTDAFSNGSLQLNPLDSDDKKRANDLYEDMDKRVTPEQRPALTGAFIEQTGVVPDKVSARVRHGLESNNPTQVAQSLTDSANIYQRAKSAVDNMENGSEIRDAAVTFQHLTDDRGMSAEEAAQHVIEMRSPERQRNAKELDQELGVLTSGDKQGKPAFLKSTDITNAYDPGILTSEPKAAFTPIFEANMMADYREIFREKYLGSAAGDKDVAKAMSVAEMKHLYGPTNVNGTPTLMKFPPENFYPPINGSWDYLKQQATKDAVAAAAEGGGVFPDKIAVTDFYIEATPDTADDIRHGRLPTYRFWYATQEDGQAVFHEVFRDGHRQGFGVSPTDFVQMREQATAEKRTQNELQRAQDRSVAESMQEQKDALAKGDTSKGFPDREQLMRDMEKRRREDQYMRRSPTDPVNPSEADPYAAPFQGQ